MGAVVMPVMVRLEQWREGQALTYGALMANGTVRLGRHVAESARRPGAPLRPDCRGQTAPNCVEYVLTQDGIVGSDDWQATDDLTWNQADQRNQRGAARLQRYLLDTTPTSDVLGDDLGLADQALRVFATHLPAYMDQAIRVYRSRQPDSGQAPAA